MLWHKNVAYNCPLKEPASTAHGKVVKGQINEIRLYEIRSADCFFLIMGWGKMTCHRWYKMTCSSLILRKPSAKRCARSCPFRSVRTQGVTLRNNFIHWSYVSFASVWCCSSGDGQDLPSLLLRMTVRGRYMQGREIKSQGLYITRPTTTTKHGSFCVCAQPSHGGIQML